MPIRQLAPDVAAKIAAGEVVERPASVVKELIENSIDAGATQIRVDLTNGGLQLIRITDNGCGIPSSELSLALARHATSKVERIDDLEHIRSLGFRGEALASIAAVAEVSLLSRSHADEEGSQVSAHSGQTSEVTPAASPEGTTVTVRNLFSAVPARLKFLKSRNTEVSHCHHLLEQYALAYPEIRFSVFSDGRQIFITPGDGRLLSVLVEVYGPQVAAQMIPIQSAQSASDPPTNPDQQYPVVSGYVSRPTCYKSTRQHISFFVNRRWVLSRMLTAAVEGAYHSLLLAGRHPIAVINVEIDPTLLDVNVHPAKTEIRFLKERRVFAAILRTARAALLDEPEMPDWLPRHTSSDNPQSPSQDASDETASQEVEEEASLIPSDNPWLTVTEEETGTRPPHLSRLWQSHISPTERSAQPEPQSEQTSAPLPLTTASRPAIQPETVETSAWSFASPTASKAIPIPPSTPLEPSAEALPNIPEVLASQQTDLRQRLVLPRLRVVGQLAQSYIVTEGEEGMYLVDQHAAHERILLERMVAALKTREALSQLLLTPLKLDLAPTELEAIEEHQPQLEHIGFKLEASDGALLVHAVPSALVRQMSARSVHELLLDLTSAENLGHTETWEERALANVACKAAIKQNYFLTISEMKEMLEQLEQTQAPFSCCHGRPTMVRFSLSALQREFERR